MSKLGKWSTTAASNNFATPDGWPEGQAPSTVNDCAREMMASIRTVFQDVQFVDQDYTPTFISATKFSVPSDVTSAVHAGRRLKLFDATAGGAATFYGTVTEASLSVGTTNVTLVLDTGVLTTSLSSFAVSILSRTNPSLPEGLRISASSVAISTTLTVGGAATLLSTLSVSGATALRNTTITGTLTATGATTLGSTLTASGAAKLLSTLSVSGESQAGFFRTDTTAVAGVVSGALTNLYLLPNTTAVAVHLALVTIGAQNDASNYGAVALIVTDGPSGRIALQNDAALLRLSLSSRQIAVIQTSGLTQTARASITTLGRTL